ncbi:MAG: malto-oligosyltrehalose trehalohydrolase [Cyanobacteriota bacterium]|nr:malto-oligosyltrehalose trehalohydrolase [Cyanobacteriota bacterium]
MIGAIYQGHNQCQFRVWAPQRQQVAVAWPRADRPAVALQPSPGGYWTGLVDQVPPGTLYEFCLDQRVSRPDPASRYQPLGVHGPSQVVDPGQYDWGDRGWGGLPLHHYVFYELHVGSFTAAGHFDAILPRLPALKALGITALELMPVAQFPGQRNWGYDGVYPFAVQGSYGGPEGLRRLVDGCHQQGLAVVLDVVYNHLGPEGNYTADFGPYLSDRYPTPWGNALNLDGPGSDGVRQYIIDNALMWVEEYHIDALRLDAIHALYDHSALPLLAELQTLVQERAARRGYPCYLIAESDLNDARIITPAAQGGYGLDAQWSDDLHHSLHSLLTGEAEGYYQDFGDLDQLAKALRQGFVYDGLYSPYRDRRHGNDPRQRSPHQFVVYGQNHDQVGNRRLGERLSTLVGWEGLKLAAATVILSANLPLLFMGEEYGETAPFLYFVDHGDPDLLEAVRQGRQREFAEFHGLAPSPDPASPETFRRCQLHWETRQQGQGGVLWRFYQTLLRLRSQLITATPSPPQPYPRAQTTSPGGLIRWQPRPAILLLINVQPEVVSDQPVLDGPWEQQLDSADALWLGPGSRCPELLAPGTELSLWPQSMVVYRRLENPA